MSTWLVIPVKSLRDGKSRLAPALDPSQRQTLMDQLLVHTLAQAAGFPGLARTVIISACDETRQRAARIGAQVLTETGSGLNAAIVQAQASISRSGASRMLMIPCDLPLLTSADLQHLSNLADTHDLVIAPDHRMLGTNGLCMSTSVDITFEFGPNSFRHHAAIAKQRGLRVAVAERPGLAFDVDTPEDLESLQSVDGFRQFYVGAPTS